MHPRKKIYAHELYKLIKMCCSKISSRDRAVIPYVLHISNRDALDIINKVIISLPDAYFYNANSIMLYDMLAFISKNLILFQVQENIENDDYSYHLIDFIGSLSREIAIKYYTLAA